MQTPVNPFKQALAAGQTQIGLWVGLADAYAAELLAGTGYDWLLIDGEHAPNDVRSVLAQLQAVSSAWSALPQRSHPVVRVPTGSAVLIKQYLDIGAQTLLVPMVDTAEQAAGLVRAMRYPPNGIRGMGSALARASRWQTYPNYLHEANGQICLLVQAETIEAMANLDAIAATPGVDGVFIGPADLSASMVTSARRVIPTCSRRSRTALRGSARPTRRPASCRRPTSRRRSGSRPAPRSSRSASTRCCWRARRRHWPRATRRASPRAAEQLLNRRRMPSPRR